MPGSCATPVELALYWSMTERQNDDIFGISIMHAITECSSVEALSCNDLVGCPHKQDITQQIIMPCSNSASVTSPS